MTKSTVDYNTPDTHRRSLLKRVVSLPLAYGLASSVTLPANAATAPHVGGLHNSRNQFSLNSTYLNGALMHPIAKGALQSIQHYLHARLMDQRAEQVDMDGDRNRAMTLFCRLFNVDSDELAWVPSTTVAENLVVSGLGLHQQGSVVTDVYHFNGSLFMYNEFAKQGLEVHIVRANNNRIELSELEKAIRPNTKLLALTLVSSVAGFQHDLKAVCDMAHAKGVMVYADIIQAAGTSPIDLHASGVDFAACSTYKWLMGDFGIGVMYARRASQAKLKRTQIGFRQEAHMQTHYLPFDPPGERLIETQSQQGLAGIIGVGTLSASGIAALTYSLDYILSLGVDTIQTWRQPILNRLRETLPSLGYPCMTPEDSQSAIISFTCEHAPQKLGPLLTKENIELSLYPNFMRISPSFYNELDDADRLIAVLKKA